MRPTAVLASALVRPAAVLTAAVPGGYGGGEGDGGKRGGEGGNGDGDGGKRGGGKRGGDGGGECRSRSTTASESDPNTAT